MRSRLKIACALCGLLFAMSCPAADEFGPFDKIEYQPLNEFWVSTGFETWHFDSGLGLNGHNPGWGIDYRFATTVSITAGKFFNSDLQDSNYLGASWHPLSAGPFRFGMFAGLLDGYPRMSQGRPFLAAVPAISAEYGRIGANLIIVPTIQDRLYGGLSLQLKLKLY
jgi:hypothetical protein